METFHFRFRKKHLIIYFSSLKINIGVCSNAQQIMKVNCSIEKIKNLKF